MILKINKCEPKAKKKYKNLQLLFFIFHHLFSFYLPLHFIDISLTLSNLLIFFYFQPDCCGCSTH